MEGEGGRERGGGGGERARNGHRWVSGLGERQQREEGRVGSRHLGELKHLLCGSTKSMFGLNRGLNTCSGVFSKGGCFLHYIDTQLPLCHALEQAI